LIVTFNQGTGGQSGLTASTASQLRVHLHQPLIVKSHHFFDSLNIHDRLLFSSTFHFYIGTKLQRRH
ncbi:hypothetical protein, partial [Lactiplantibacillus pentosus]